ncbi:MAG: NAD(P)H-hydrate epimerase [Deltaproteobacteria bacterium]|jgi:NAD(P)H-hydrate epimerase|nr:NAD(P)H-hydrate epimerase [Deltaproteobacteria bacterium]
MRILTAKEIQELEKRTFLTLGLPSLLIMENAGRAVVDVILNHFKPDLHKEILILCGSGNNGGDGFVVARTLKNLGFSVFVFCTRRIEHISSDARFQAQAFKNLGGSICEIPACPDWDNQFSTKILNCGLIVDALLGTGFNGQITISDLSLMIDLINIADCPIISIDLPSGLNATTGTAGAVAVYATVTVAFQYPKLGLFIADGISHSGTIYVCDIGLITQPAINNEIQRELLTQDFIVKELQEWHKKNLAIQSAKLSTLNSQERLQKIIQIHDLHKTDQISVEQFTDAGMVVLLGGHLDRISSIYATAKIAQQCGLRKASLVLPYSVAKKFIPESLTLQCVGLADDGEGYLARVAENEILTLLEKADVLMLGAGLKENAAMKELIKIVFTSANKLKLPVVIDSDVLSFIAKDSALRLLVPETAILTPTKSVIAKLLDVQIENVKISKIECAGILSRVLNSIVILKNERSVIADPQSFMGLSSINIDLQDLPELDDVLNGMLVTLLAQGMNPTSCACISVFVQGLVSELMQSQLALGRSDNWINVAKLTAQCFNDLLLTRNNELALAKCI